MKTKEIGLGTAKPSRQKYKKGPSMREENSFFTKKPAKPQKISTFFLFD
jgi:hypothetical protein